MVIKIPTTLEKTTVVLKVDLNKQVESLIKNQSKIKSSIKNKKYTGE